MLFTPFPPCPPAYQSERHILDVLVLWTQASNYKVRVWALRGVLMGMMGKGIMAGVLGGRQGRTVMGASRIWNEGAIEESGIMGRGWVRWAVGCWSCIVLGYMKWYLDGCIRWIEGYWHDWHPCHKTPVEYYYSSYSPATYLPHWPKPPWRAYDYTSWCQLDPLCWLYQLDKQTCHFH